MLNLATALAGAAGIENEVRVEAVHLLGAALVKIRRGILLVKHYLV